MNAQRHGEPVARDGRRGHWAGRAGSWRFSVKPRPLESLLLTCVLLTCASAGAQNYVKNPDFEQPLGTNNWTVVYVYGGPSDFSVHDRTTIAHKDKVPGTWDGEPNYLDVYGAEFEPYHDGKMWAYFKQAVTGLKPGSNYVTSAWIVQFEALYTNKVQVYLEVMGGAAGNVSRTSPNVYKACNNNPSAWAMYAVTNTASASGQLEVRLHFNKDKWTTLSWQYIRAYYDHVAVMLPGQTPPPFKIVSLSVTNPSAPTLRWETVMNNTYDVEAASNLGTWSKLYTGLLATGTSMPITGNAPAAPAKPQFFRVFSRSYVP
jgi:hypothetical protein